MNIFGENFKPYLAENKISLIISIYDKYDFLYLVLKSIENQTFKNFEVILAEDCEKKELLKKLKEWRKKFSLR